MSWMLNCLKMFCEPLWNSLISSMYANHCLKNQGSKGSVSTVTSNSIDEIQYRTKRDNNLRKRTIREKNKTKTNSDANFSEAPSWDS